MVNDGSRTGSTYFAVFGTATIVLLLVYGRGIWAPPLDHSPDPLSPPFVAAKSKIIDVVESEIIDVVESEIIDVVESERPPKNVILTSLALNSTSFVAAIVDLDSEAEKIIRNFVGSYRRINGTADIFILSNVEAPASATVQTALRKYNVTWLVMDEQANVADGGTVLPFGNILRHQWFRHVLRDLFPGRYDRVVVADSRDVYFQADPFLIEYFPDLTFTMEEALVKRGDFFYRRSLGSGYTLQETKQYHGHMICAGVFLGKTEPMLLFFKEMVAEAIKRKWTKSDQHYIFHIIRQGKLPNLNIKLSSAKEIAWHIKKKHPPTPEFFVNERGLITNEEGTVIRVLHHIHNPRAKNVGRYLDRYRPPFEPNSDLAGVRYFTDTGESLPL